MRRFRDWKEKALQNPELLKEYLRLGEEELATAKAENGRLAEALSHYSEGQGMSDKPLEFLTKIAACLNPETPGYEACKSELVRRELMSNSNALDYWQGEIRKSEARVLDDVIVFVEGKYVEANSASDIGFNGALGFVEEFCLKSRKPPAKSKGKGEG